MTKQSITHTFDKFIADDGTEFDSELKCVSYEFTKSLTKPKQQLWVVFNRYKQGTAELFSSRELAQLSLKEARNSSHFIIEPIEIDARFIYDLNHETYPEYKWIAKLKPEGI